MEFEKIIQFCSLNLQAFEIFHFRHPIRIVLSKFSLDVTVIDIFWDNLTFECQWNAAIDWRMRWTQTKCKVEVEVEVGGRRENEKWQPASDAGGDLVKKGRPSNDTFSWSPFWKKNEVTWKSPHYYKNLDMKSPHIYVPVIKRKYRSTVQNLLQIQYCRKVLWFIYTNDFLSNVKQQFHMHFNMKHCCPYFYDMDAPIHSLLLDSSDNW